MLNMNRVTLLGHAGRDPEVRTMKSGDRTATFSLATTEKWRRQDGETGEATEWHRIAVFGGAVESAATFVRKGSALLIEGRLATREYRDKRGRARRVTEIVVAGPQGLVNVLSPRQDDGRAEDGGEAAGTGDAEGIIAAPVTTDSADGTVDAPASTGEPDGDAPAGPSRFWRRR